MSEETTMTDEPQPLADSDDSAERDLTEDDLVADDSAADDSPEDDLTDDDTAPIATAAEIAPQLEALLLMAEEPVPTAVLAEAVGAPVPVVEEALADLTDFYASTGRGFGLRAVGGGWRYATRPEYHELLSRWVVEGQVNRLTQAGLETLAVIAYLQPVSRARVSAVRGVNVDSAVRTLLARDLITEEGQDDQTGAALLRTTEYFLERIGLASLDDLPPIAPRLPEAAALEAELAALTEEGDVPPGDSAAAGEAEAPADGDTATTEEVSAVDDAPATPDEDSESDDNNAEDNNDEGDDE